MGHRLLVPAFAVLCVCVCALTAQSSRPGEAPPRDTPAGGTGTSTATPSGKIAGRVLAANDGRPVRRARVFLSAPQLPEGRGTLTDDNGVFEVPDLPAGRYTLSVSKTGFVTLSYGQRRPLQAGTPIQLGDGQQLKGVDFRLPRGSVIAGHVFDELGEPMPGATVRIMQYQYAQGERQLTQAATERTDDQGHFRVWGLNPGEYYVTAVTQNFSFGRGGPAGRGIAAALAGRGRGAAIGGRAGFPVPPPPPGGFLDFPGAEELQKAYAPTYFPGVPSVNEARTVTVGIGQELQDINFNLLLVRTAQVSGTVTSDDGSTVYSGQVNLAPEVGPGRNQPGTTFGGRINWEGKFTIANVPPGRYVLRARGTDSDQPLFSELPVTVASGDETDLAVVLFPGASIAGTITFDGTDAPQLNQVRVSAPSIEPGASFGQNPNARVDKEGAFTLQGLSIGAHWIRANGQLRGWSLKSVLVDGRDMIDRPMELRSGQHVGNVNLVFTNKQQEINGTVTNERGDPVTEFTVLAFGTDPDLWRPLARQIATARPDQNGKYQIKTLPPGNYFLVTVDPAEQGEWFEPSFLDQQRIAGSRVSLGEGDIKTHDFRINTR